MLPEQQMPADPNRIKRLPVWLSRLAVFFCLNLAASAQFTNLTATDDGSALYFVSRFRLASYSGSQQSFYVWDALGFRPLLQTGQSLDISGDGSVVSYTNTTTISEAQSACPFGPHPCVVTTYQTLIQLPVPAAAMVVAATVRLSANGRYALLSGPALLDLATGQRTSIPLSTASQPYAGGRVVTSDGTVYLGNFIWNKVSGVRQVPGPGLISDDATRIVFTDSEGKLASMDLTTGARRDIDQGVALRSFTGDGQWIGYTALVDRALQAFSIRSDGSGRRQLTDEPSGVGTMSLSGSGTVAYVATGNNSLLRIDFSSDALDSMVLVPPTPMPDYIEGSSPGSQGIVHVSGVVEQSITGTPPLSTDLAGFQVLLNGRPVPVVSVSPADVRFQIPWETPTNYYGSSASAQLVIPGAIFAAAPGALGLVSFKPVFEGIPCLFANGLSAVCAVAAHGDFSGLLSGEDPARAGEVIHFYMRGLGPVTPAVATGEAAPDSPLSRVQQGFSCFLYESNRLSGLPILFAGLAPGLVGIYQVSMQLPPQVQTDLPQVVCVIDFGIMGNQSATTRIYATPSGP